MASFLHFYGFRIRPETAVVVLISFREWLHSYIWKMIYHSFMVMSCSHLFQRVASFLPTEAAFLSSFLFFLVLISFREWLHSYDLIKEIDVSLRRLGSHLFQRVASFLHHSTDRSESSKTCVLISFREWLHSYF